MGFIPFLIEYITVTLITKFTYSKSAFLQRKNMYLTLVVMTVLTLQ